MLMDFMQSMSPVFDGFWWWRSEFAGLTNPYEKSARDEIPSSQICLNESLLANVQLPSEIGTTPNIDDQFLSLEPFPDWDWMATQFPG